MAHKLNQAMREQSQRHNGHFCERTSKQCRERWIHNLAPHVCKDVRISAALFLLADRSAHSSAHNVGHWRTFLRPAGHTHLMHM